MKLLILLPFVLLPVLLALVVRDCTPKLEIGQTYAEAKAVCPDIEGRARWADSTTASYLCPSKSVIVVGSKHTGRMVGFFLWTGD